MELAQVKYALGHIVRVKIPSHYIDSRFILTGCMLRKNDKGGYYYQAEVQDMESSSVMIVKLDDVERIEDNEQENEQVPG